MERKPIQSFLYSYLCSQFVLTMELSFLYPYNTSKILYSAVYVEVGGRINEAQPAVDTTLKTEKPTLAQIRYWQRQRENRLLVNGKRYMEPKTEVNLVTTTILPEKGIGLPVRERNTLNTDWLTVILVLALVLFASVKFSFSKYLNHLFQSIVNYATSIRMFEEKSNSISSGAALLEVIFYLTLSLFLFQVGIYFNLKFPFQNLILYLLFLGGVLIFFGLKKLVYRVIGNVIEGREETGEYLFNHDNFNRVTGLILFPIVTLIAFSPFERTDILLFVGGSVLVGFYILLLGRGISILLKKQFSIFYLFLYLCSLEFLPLLLIYKIVVV